MHFLACSWIALVLQHNFDRTMNKPPEQCPNAWHAWQSHSLPLIILNTEQDPIHAVRRGAPYFVCCEARFTLKLCCNRLTQSRSKATDILHKSLRWYSNFALWSVLLSPSGCHTGTCMSWLVVRVWPHISLTNGFVRQGRGSKSRLYYVRLIFWGHA